VLRVQADSRSYLFSSVGRASSRAGFGCELRDKLARTLAPPFPMATRTSKSALPGERKLSMRITLAATARAGCKIVPFFDKARVVTE
jgi:hypothetical protein